MPSVILQVNASSDDANQTSGTQVLTSDSSPTIVQAGAWLGARFTTVPLGGSYTITSAYLEMYAHDSANDEIHFVIYGEDEDDAATFAATASNISNRTTTSGSVSWDSASVGVGWQASPDITTIIQEIIDRGGWSQYNALAVLLNSTSGVDFEPRMYDYTGNSYGARLIIEYTVGTLAAATTLSVTVSVVAPTVSGDSGVTVSTLSVTVSTVSPAAVTGVLAAVNALAVTVSTVSPTVSLGTNQSISLSALAVTVSTVSPTAMAGALAAVNTQTLTTSLVDRAVTTNSNAVALTVPVVLTASVLSLMVSGDCAVTVSTLTATVSAVSPTAMAGALAAVGEQSLTASVVDPTISGDAVAVASTQAVTVAAIVVTVSTVRNIITLTLNDRSTGLTLNDVL